jgi:ferredoxin--NADP+ reductase
MGPSTDGPRPPSREDRYDGKGWSNPPKKESYGSPNDGGAEAKTSAASIMAIRRELPSVRATGSGLRKPSGGPRAAQNREFQSGDFPVQPPEAAKVGAEGRMSDPRYASGIVTWRRAVSSELWIVRVRPEERISFSPGQYVTVGLPRSEKMVERPYSVASSPREQELEFFVELVPEGALTPRLYEVPVGGRVYLRRAAKGRFLYDNASGRRHQFMVATVTGVAPYVSMLRDLAARASEGQRRPHQIVLLQAASVSSELGYREELETYAWTYEWFEYVPTISRAWLDPAWSGERGRAEDVTRKYLDGFGFTAEHATAYLCGNPHMIENVKGVLRRAGFPKESIREEVYWVADTVAA